MTIYNTILKLGMLAQLLVSLAFGRGKQEAHKFSLSSYMVSSRPAWTNVDEAGSQRGRVGLGRGLHS